MVTMPIFSVSFQFQFSTPVASAELKCLTVLREDQAFHGVIVPSVPCHVVCEAIYTSHCICVVCMMMDITCAVVQVIERQLGPGRRYTYFINPGPLASIPGVPSSPSLHTAY